jgi:hypothetical protein
MTSTLTIGTEHQRLEGRTVRDIVEHDPAQVNEVWCRKIFRQLLQSLELQYAMHMPHRAITPDTVVFHDNGEPLLLPRILPSPTPTRTKRPTSRRWPGSCTSRSPASWRRPARCAAAPGRLQRFPGHGGRPLHGAGAAPIGRTHRRAAPHPRHRVARAGSADADGGADAGGHDRRSARRSTPHPLPQPHSTRFPFRRPAGASRRPAHLHARCGQRAPRHRPVALAALGRGGRRRRGADRDRAGPVCRTARFRLLRPYRADPAAVRRSGARRRGAGAGAAGRAGRNRRPAPARRRTGSRTPRMSELPPPAPLRPRQATPPRRRAPQRRPSLDGQTMPRRAQARAPPTGCRSSPGAWSTWTASTAASARP